MSFGAALQAPNCHRSLLALQDSEITLLELIKKCLAQRVRSDRDYANSLTAIINLANKVDANGSTPLFQVWSNIVKETEELVNLLRDHAEKISTRAIEKLAHIITEKRTARKFYNDERLRIDMEFNKMKDEVNKLRLEYEKSVNRQIQERLKYEELASKVVSGKKLDDARSKLVKASLKLHKVHNDYVAALREVTLHQHNYLETLLPGILDYQEEVQKCLVTQCKSVLEDYADLTDLSTPGHNKHFQSIRSLAKMLTPTSEYIGFVQDNKGPQIAPLTFAFDIELLQSYKGNLQCNELAVDNLTVEHIYHSHSRVKDQLADCQQKLSSKQTLLATQKEQMAKIQLEKDDLDEMQRNTYGIHKRAVLDLEREIQELQCRQTVSMDLEGLYAAEIARLGGQDPPPALDLQDPGPPNPSNNHRDGKKDNSEKKKDSSPDKKKDSSDKRKDSSPNKKRDIASEKKKVASPNEKISKIDESLPSPRSEENGKSDGEVSSPDSGSNTSTGRNLANNISDKVSNLFNLKRKTTSSSAAPPLPPVKDFHRDPSYIDSDTQNNRAYEPQGQQQRMLSVENNTLRGMSSPPPDGYQQMSFEEELRRSHKQSPLTADPNRPLEEEEWFHGVLPREEVQRLLTTDGDYLVRESKNRKTGEVQYVLSVFWTDHKHFIIQGSENNWRFESEQYTTVQELIISQHNSDQPVTRKSGAMLKRPIVHESWELRNADIILGQKIGNGNFGDVFKGTYKKQSLEVAVKTCRETLSEDAKKKFLQEGRILKQYDHPNIVRFIGIAAQRHPVMIVMEFVPGGALITFLKKQGIHQTKRQLIKMASDASAGMEYLESRGCIHRDLAARNCLVGKTNVVKISDFGMSREEEEYQVSGGLKQIPIKWTAPEALNYGTYTSACDVWSFGILMWEIFSFGQSPYPGLTNTQARERVDDGYRMPMPDGTPQEAYDLMLKAWDAEPKNRPLFAEIHKELEKIHKRLPFR